MTRTTPRYITCPRCGRRAIEARWDYQGDMLIGTPLLDPVKLTLTQITAAVITSIPLWQIQEHAGRPITSRRHTWWPRRPVDGTTVPEHACGRVWDAPTVDLAVDDPTYPDQPPF